VVREQRGIAIEEERPVLWTIGVDQQAADRRDPGLVWAAWRAAAEDVWATSAELRRASADEREAAYAQHLAALSAEASCATDLAALPSERQAEWRA
jgi:NADPH-dependent glutamate synthase beta subunit-like oxidoreductase